LKQWTPWLLVAVFVGIALTGTLRHQVAVREAPAPGAIVSLSPNVTEIVFALGLGHRLIGVSTACDYPPEVKRLRQVGDLGAPDVELVRALRPELIVTTPLRDPEVAKALRATGVQIVEVRQSSIADVPFAVETIGRAAGVATEARALADRMRRRIHDATRDVADDQRPRLYVELSPHPLRTAGKGSFLDELIERAGGRNIARDFPTPWLTISPEDVIVRNPQIILLTHTSETDPVAVIARRVGWSNIAAVRGGWVVSDPDPDLILRPGPRLVDGLEALAELFARYREDAAP